MAGIDLRKGRAGHITETAPLLKLRRRTSQSRPFVGQGGDASVSERLESEIASSMLSTNLQQGCLAVAEGASNLRQRTSSGFHSLGKWPKSGLASDRPGRFDYKLTEITELGQAALCGCSPCSVILARVDSFRCRKTQALAISILSQSMSSKGSSILMSGGEREMPRLLPVKFRFLDLPNIPC